MGWGGRCVWGRSRVRGGRRVKDGDRMGMEMSRRKSWVRGGKQFWGARCVRREKWVRGWRRDGDGDFVGGRKWVLEKEMSMGRMMGFGTESALRRETGLGREMA